MTPRQIAIVQDSFAKIAPIAPQAADIFYDRLFEVAPQVRALFPDDMAAQKRNLMAMLGTAVNGLTRLDAILPSVQDLGRRHVVYGAKAAHYPVVGSCLLYALERGLGDSWSEELEEAWAAAYGLLSGVMIAAAEKVTE